MSAINGRNGFHSHDRRSCVPLHDGRDDHNAHQDHSQDFLQAVRLQLRLHFLRLRRKDGFQPGQVHSGHRRQYRRRSGYLRHVQPGIQPVRRDRFHWYRLLRHLQPCHLQCHRS